MIFKLNIPVMLVLLKKRLQNASANGNQIGLVASLLINDISVLLTQVSYDLQLYQISLKYVNCILKLTIRLDFIEGAIHKRRPHLGEGGGDGQPKADKLGQGEG